MTTNPTKLSYLDKVRVVFAHEVLGVSQHTLAAMYGVNGGRVAEAVVDVRKALKSPEQRKPIEAEKGSIDDIVFGIGTDAIIVKSEV